MGDPMTLADPNMPWFSVKEAVLPFARFPGVDTILGPEMRSTGEVMGWDVSFARAFLKAQMGAGVDLPTSGKAFLSIKDSDKTDQLVDTAQILVAQGFTILATSGTATFLAEHDVPSEVVRKHYEGGRTVVDIMKDGEVVIVMNTTEGAQAVEDSRSMRNVALMDKIPYFTTAAGAHAAARAIGVEEDLSRFQPLGQPELPGPVAGPERGHKAVVGAVGNPDRLCLILKRDQGDDGAENLILGKGMIGWDIPDKGWCGVIAALGQAIGHWCLGQYLVRGRLRQKPVDNAFLAGGNQRADICVFKGWGDFQGMDSGRQSRGQFIVNLALHKDA